MRIDKSIREFRRRMLPAKGGLALLLLFFLFVAAWNWFFPATPEEEAAMSQQQWPTGEEAPEENPPETGDAAEASGPEPDEAQVAAAYFAAYRMDREEARSTELILLEQIIADENSSPEAVAQAEQRRLSIASCSELEHQAESLLSAKGFGETVVILGEQRATVIVDVEMNAQKATQIAEAVDSVSACGFENVVVVNR